MHLGLQVGRGGVAPPLLAVGQHGQPGGVEVAGRQSVEAQPQLAHHVGWVGGEALGVAALLVLEEAQQQDGVRLMQGELDLQAGHLLSMESESIQNRLLLLYSLFAYESLPAA